MPLRSQKMNRFIFGFQRRVWWPKWTPASSNCLMVTTAIRNVTPSHRLRVQPGASARAFSGAEATVGAPGGVPRLPKGSAAGRHPSAPGPRAAVPAGPPEPLSAQRRGASCSITSRRPVLSLLGRDAYRERSASGGSAVGQAEPAAQLHHGLGVDLAHPALGHAEHLADL